MRSFSTASEPPIVSAKIDDAYLQSLEVEALCGLSMRLLADLKEAWDRLNQGPDHSSRPPSSRAPWERTGSTLESEEAPETLDRDRQPAEAQPTEAKPTEAKPTRKPGKQPPAPAALLGASGP